MKLTSLKRSWFTRFIRKVLREKSCYPEIFDFSDIDIQFICLWQLCFGQIIKISGTFYNDENWTTKSHNFTPDFTTDFTPKVFLMWFPPALLVLAQFIGTRFSACHCLFTPHNCSLTSQGKGWRVQNGCLSVKSFCGTTLYLCKTAGGPPYECWKCEDKQNQV